MSDGNAKWYVGGGLVLAYLFLRGKKTIGTGATLDPPPPASGVVVVNPEADVTIGATIGGIGDEYFYGGQRSTRASVVLVWVKEQGPPPRTVIVDVTNGTARAALLLRNALMSEGYQWHALNR